MTGQCWCGVNIWEVDNFLSLVADQPEDTPPEHRIIGGLSFCSEEHLELYLQRHPHMRENTKIVGPHER